MSALAIHVEPVTERPVVPTYGALYYLRSIGPDAAADLINEALVEALFSDVGKGRSSCVDDLEQIVSSRLGQQAIDYILSVMEKRA